MFDWESGIAGRLHSALGYRSPEEFERQSAENSADSLGATVEFVVNSENNENEKRIATELSGEEDSNAVLFPRPLSLLADARTLLENGKCAQSFCDSLRGHLIRRGQLGAKTRARMDQK